MTLESLLKPIKFLDKKIQKQYTRIGRIIPEKHLYKMTTAMQWAGKVGTATWGDYLGINPIFAGIISATFLDGADWIYNLDGLKGRIKKETNEALALDATQHFVQRYNKAVRLPVFLTGIGFLGKISYELGNYLLNGEPVSEDFMLNSLSSFGFLSLATSMYLKDQDPKLLEKSPSKIKAFFEKSYERAKGLISPNPTPQPVPIRINTTETN